MQSRRTFALWLFLFCLISPLTVAQVYKVTDLGPLAPTAINNWGQVAGNLNGHAFIWTKWGSLDLGTLAGGTSSRAAGINDFAEVAGTADGLGTITSPDDPAIPPQECSDLTQPFVWTPRKGMQGLGTIVIRPAFSGWYACDIGFYATGLNALGRVVGYTSAFSDYQYNFLWTETAGMTSFLGPDFGNWPPTFANAISNTGQIVGQSSSWLLFTVGHATSWNNGNVTDLGTLGGGQDVVDYGSSANAINDLGQAVGWSTTGSVSWMAGSPVHAVLWTPSGAIRDLGTLSGDTSSAATKINFFGQVIGSSGDAIYSDGWAPQPYEVPGRPFIWSARSGMQDLNTLIAAKKGWVLNSATGINFWGQIVGSGTLNGQPHGFLLTPKF